jgi:endonuclease I
MKKTSPFAFFSFSFFLRRRISCKKYFEVRFGRVTWYVIKKMRSGAIVFGGMALLRCGAVADMPPPEEYYADIDATATNDELKGQLQDLISVHKVFSYDDAWSAFEEIDKNLPGYPCSDDPTHIPDIYSGYCWTPQQGMPTGGECGNYKKEGDCFNREHIWPKSWFGGFDEGENAQTDLFELWPSDGYVNGLRGNLPLGDVDPAHVTYNSTNGALIGKCSSDGYYDGNCMELPDGLKGDIARSYFYLSTAYWNVWSCCDTDEVDGSDIKPAMENEMRKWHAGDAVDETEMNRLNAIYYDWQNNRNPFIDHPEWVDQISDF